MSKVYLVGAGPGDPDLITWKGRRVLEHADVVLFDHLASSALVDLAPPDAERIYVGKKKALHAFTQEEICAMLIERARRGKCRRWRWPRARPSGSRRLRHCRSAPRS